MNTESNFKGKNKLFAHAEWEGCCLVQGCVTVTVVSSVPEAGKGSLRPGKSYLEKKEKTKENQKQAQCTVLIGTSLTPDGLVQAPSVSLWGPLTQPDECFGTWRIHQNVSSWASSDRWEWKNWFSVPCLRHASPLYPQSSSLPFACWCSSHHIITSLYALCCGS